MPPKKAQQSSIVGEYDVEIMTIEELKKYVEALEKEHVRMRKERDLYQKDRNELLNILKCIQEKIIDRKGMAMQKTIEIQERLLEEEQNSKYEDMLNRITELEKNDKAERDIFQSFLTVKTAELVNRQEENALLDDIKERDREIQHMEFLSKLTLTELTENNFKKWYGLSEKSNQAFELFVREYIEKYVHVLRDFSENKMDTFWVMLEGVEQSENNLFAILVEKMSTYFKDIFWKNIKTMNELNSKLVNLKRELNTVTLNLKDVIKDTNNLKTRMYQPNSPNASSIASSAFSSSKVKALEDLTYENFLLTVKLQMVLRDHNDLKKKFVSSVRRIHQNANFKALILEQKLSLLQSLTENEAENISKRMKNKVPDI